MVCLQTGVWKQVLRMDVTTNLGVDREYRMGDSEDYDDVERWKKPADVQLKMVQMKLKK
jgi:hypothetical protein